MKKDSGDWHLDSAAPVRPMTIRQRCDTTDDAAVAEA